MEEALASGKKIEEIQLEFMYKPPPGLEEFDEALKRNEAKEKEKIAPVEGSYAKKHEIQHKQFGVLNAICAQCGEKGHQSGDRVCMFNSLKLGEDGNPVNESAETPALEDTSYTNEFLEESNLRLKEKLKRQEGGSSRMYDDDPEQEFLDSLSKKDKQMLLKYLAKKERKKRKRQERM